MKSTLVSKKNIALFGITCLLLLSSYTVSFATSITSYFTFENDENLTGSPFGTLVINKSALNTLEFIITADTGKLGSNADIHQFGFMLNYGGVLTFNSYSATPFSGHISNDKVSGRNSDFSWVVSFGDGTPTYNPVTFSITGDGLTIGAINTAGWSSQNSKPDAQFLMHVQSTVTLIGSTSEAVGGSYNGNTPVPEPATMLLFGAGLAGLAGFARRKVR